MQLPRLEGSVDDLQSFQSLLGDADLGCLLLGAVDAEVPLGFVVVAGVRFSLATPCTAH